MKSKTIIIIMYFIWIGCVLLFLSDIVLCIYKYEYNIAGAWFCALVWCVSSIIQTMRNNKLVKYYEDLLERYNRIIHNITLKQRISSLKDPDLN